MIGRGRRIQFFLSILGLGTFLSLLATTPFSPGEARNFLLLLALGIAAEWLAIPLRTGWTTASEAIYYAGFILLGPARGAVLAFTCVLGGYLAGTPRKMGRLTAVSVLAGTFLTLFPALAAGEVFSLFGSPHFLASPLLCVAALAAAAIVFNLLNNGLAMLYLLLEQGGNPIELWLLNQLDEQLFSFSAVMPFLGILLALLLAAFPAAALALFIPLVYSLRQAMQSHASLLANARKTMETLADALDARDGSTYHHSMRVSKLAAMLARRVGLRQEEVERIEWAAKIHDLGKIAILDSVLKKAGPLTEDEFHHMKYHPVAGAKVAGTLGFCREEARMVECHHEKFDGTGYPLGLKGDEIPLGARIISVADFFDALTSHRVYRKGMKREEVERLLESNKATHFDPAIVDAFLSLLKEKGDTLLQAA